MSKQEKIIEAFNNFLTFIQKKDCGRTFSFVDRHNFLGREEAYKIDSAVFAQNELKYEEWQESWINTGEIIKRCIEAVKRAGNLVYFQNKIAFNNKINNPEAERALYEIYKSRTSDEEKTAFENAKKIFGGRYDLISYLFFVKDYSRFLPVSPENFDRIFRKLEINHELSHRCSWENYTGFIAIVKEIRGILQKFLPENDVRLIDAHSFLWVIGRI